MKSLLVLLIVFIPFCFFCQEKDTLILSYSSGWYSDPIEVEINNESESKIFYSLDGSFPTKIYKKPISIKETTTLRVRNKLSNKEKVVNYLFINRKPTLPAVCITLSPGDLFDSTKGIYVKGLNASPIPPYKGANFHKNWERKAYIELIELDSTIGISQAAGIKIFGQFSAMLPQKSFSVHARSRYGKKKFKCKLFPDLPYKKYKSFILRNSGSDYCNTHFRDIMMTSLVKGLNFDVQAYRSATVFINGKYWGIYHIREKINEHFLKQHYGVNKDSVAILKHRGDVQQYGRINYKSIIKFIKKTDFRLNKNIDSLSKLIDIDNYLDYNIAQVYFNNIDAGGNIRYWRHRKKNSKWRWILFDTDFGFGLRKGNDVDENTLKKFTSYNNEKWPSPPWSTLIIRKLLQNDSIEKIYINKLTHYLNTYFKEENVLNHILEIENKLREEMPNHFKRWNRRIEKWDEQIELVKDFAQRRPNFMREHMKQKFDIDTFYTINFNYNKGGTIKLNGYHIDSGFNGKYIINYPYKIRIIPDFGFSYNTDLPRISDEVFKLIISKPTTVRCRFIKNKASILKEKIYFNEIVINDSSKRSWIELFNSTEKDLDLSGWIIRKNKKEKYIISSGTVLKSKKHFSISTIDTLGKDKMFTFKKGDLLELFTDKERIVDSLNLKKKWFKQSQAIEFVSTEFKRGWVKSKGVSINSENISQKEKKLEEKLIIGSIVLLILTFLFLLIKLIFEKRKRPSGATE